MPGIGQGEGLWRSLLTVSQLVGVPMDPLLKIDCPVFIASGLGGVTDWPMIAQTVLTVDVCSSIIIPRLEFIGGAQEE